jgi:hypothetical protein
MATLYRAGDLALHNGRYFACATLTAAKQWAIDLRRPHAPIVEVEIDDDQLVIVSTHGYVESDWRYGDFTPLSWDDLHWVESLVKKARVYRIEMPAKEAVEILSLFEGVPEYDAHEIVW